jgi:hypothetical protein
LLFSDLLFSGLPFSELSFSRSFISRLSAFRPIGGCLDRTQLGLFVFLRLFL